MYKQGKGVVLEDQLTRTQTLMLNSKWHGLLLILSIGLAPSLANSCYPKISRTVTRVVVYRSSAQPRYQLFRPVQRGWILASLLGRVLVELEEEQTTESWRYPE